MAKIANPYQVMLERLRVLDQSIYVLNLVNNDFREILHKHKPLPQFIHQSFKRSTASKSKTTPALPPPPPPAETEEMRLVASIIDKAKRTIENVGEKKPKQLTTVLPSVLTSVQLNTNHNNNRPKSSSSVRPSSASSTIPPSSNTPPSQPQSVRRYVPAHMKAPFQTQPEKKRRPSSSTRNSIQTNSNQRPSTTRRSLSQQRQQSSSSITQSIVEFPPQTISIPFIPPLENETIPMINNQNINGITHEIIVSDQTSVETPINVSNETDELEICPIPQQIILNRALIKPLRRLWKQNQNLRLRLIHALEKKSTSSPLFIDRLNEQIHSSAMTDEIRVPNLEVLLQLAIKLRAIVLYLLENSTFDDLDGALKRLTTLKYLVNRYHFFFTSNANILVANHHHRSSNINTNVDEWLNKSTSFTLNRNTVRYTDDGQLIAFTEVRFKQFENECRWIELNWHEQMITQFKQSLSNKNQNPLQIYRELMSLVTGLQTSTPIVVENRLE